MRNDALVHELEAMVDALGFELVEAELGGTRARPVVRLKIDRPDSAPGQGVMVEDCVRVSRALEAELDQRPGTSPAYVLEVSSPGVERPLVRRRDWERFAGQEVALRGTQALAGRAKRLEGTLLGLRGAEGEERVALRLGDDEEVEVPLAEISRAHLVFHWGSQERR